MGGGDFVLYSMEEIIIRLQKYGPFVKILYLLCFFFFFFLFFFLFVFYLFFFLFYTSFVLLFA